MQIVSGEIFRKNPWNTKVRKWVPYFEYFKIIYEVLAIIKAKANSVYSTPANGFYL